MIRALSPRQVALPGKQALFVLFALALKYKRIESALIGPAA